MVWIKNHEMIDYEDVRAKALEHKPKMIVAGASAYSRTIDFAKFREIADEIGAYLMVDMAHIAGLVAAGEHPSPVPHAHFVTSTTHKTFADHVAAYFMQRRICEENRQNDFPRYSRWTVDACNRF